MASYDDERRELFDLLEAGLGSRGAALLMTNLPPVGWADLATKADLAVTHADMTALRSDLKGEMSEVRGEMAEVRGEMAEVRGEMAMLRAELTGEMARLRGDMNAQVPKLVSANIASMIGVAGIVIAAGALL
jgi:hypothetical protein